MCWESGGSRSGVEGPKLRFWRVRFAVNDGSSHTTTDSLNARVTVPSLVLACVVQKGRIQPEMRKCTRQPGQPAGKQQKRARPVLHWGRQIVEWPDWRGPEGSSSLPRPPPPRVESPSNPLAIVRCSAFLAVGDPWISFYTGTDTHSHGARNTCIQCVFPGEPGKGWTRADEGAIALPHRRRSRARRIQRCVEQGPSLSRTGASRHSMCLRFVCILRQRQAKPTRAHPPDCSPPVPLPFSPPRSVSA